jgi:hypothetical protein
MKKESHLKIPKRVLHIQEVIELSAEKMKTRKKSVRNYLGDVHPPFEGKTLREEYFWFKTCDGYGTNHAGTDKI